MKLLSKGTTRNIDTRTALYGNHTPVFINTTNEGMLVEITVNANITSDSSMLFRAFRKSDMKGYFNTNNFIISEDVYSIIEPFDAPGAPATYIKKYEMVIPAGTGLIFSLPTPVSGNNHFAFEIYSK